MSNEGGAREPIEDAVRQAVGVEAGAPAWVVIATRVGILVACVGGLLGGINTLGEMWHRWNLHAAMQVTLDPHVTVSLDRASHRVSFLRRLTILNTGEAIGALPGLPSARLESVTQPPREIHAVELDDIEAQDGNQQVYFPLALGASQSRDVNLRMSAQSTASMDTAFPKAGIYKLLLQIESPGTPEPDAYCFELTAEAVSFIEKSGMTRTLQRDCAAPVGPVLAMSTSP